MLALENSGIAEHEVRQVLDTEARWPRLGLDGTAPVGTLALWGRTPSGRALMVAVYHVGGFDWKIIGARDLTAEETAELTRWEETR